MRVLGGVIECNLSWSPHFTSTKVSFSIKIPTRFEIEFFSVKMMLKAVQRTTYQPVIHLTPLRLVKEMENSAERIGNNLYEISEKTKRNLNM